MNKYKEGDVVKARITAVERYGAFAAIDDEYSGLIHISEFTDKFVKSINDYVGIGDIINVKILNCDGKSNQLRLSAKDVNPRQTVNLFLRVQWFESISPHHFRIASSPSGKASDFDSDMRKFESCRGNHLLFYICPVSSVGRASDF